MSVAAILGAGPIGGAIAHRLAKRAAFREIRLIDAATGVAEGKALDILQSGPVEHFDTMLAGSADVLSACGASVIIVADTVALGEWEGETGLALVRQLMRAGTEAPFVFAGVKQTWLMEASARELGVARDRLVGTAPATLVGAARALAAAEIDGSSKDVAVSVVGRPPAFVVAWSAATVAGTAIAERIAPHRLRAISQALRTLWPAGPQAIGAVTAEVAAGLAFGARRQLPAMTVLDGELGIRGVAALLPVELGGGRVTRRFVPTLSAQERTEFQNALETSRA